MNRVLIFCSKSCLLVLICTLFTTVQVYSQNGPNFFTTDIDLFWKAFDAVQVEPDSAKQVELMKHMYTDKGTPGLKKYMEVMDFDAAKLVACIHKYPKFWASIRPNTLQIKEKIPAIEAAVEDFRKLYPELRNGKMYFTIAATRSAGTVMDSTNLLGTEVVTGNKSTDVSEFKDNRLSNFFKNQGSDNILWIAIHEYIHTQQKTDGNNILLGQCLTEGAADFVAEKVLKSTLTNSYIVYGRSHEDTLKVQFKKEMMGESYDNWMYNWSRTKTMGDLGYFMGYTICKSYYQHAKDKKKAIKDIITLDYSNQAAILKFLEDSKYYN